MNGAATGCLPRGGRLPSWSYPPFAKHSAFGLKLGFISFGGPAGQIAIMQTELVEKRRWIGHASFCTRSISAAPSRPEAQQLATYIGWLLHRHPRGLAAGILFVLPFRLHLWASVVVYVSAARFLDRGDFLRTQTRRHGHRRGRVIRIGRKSLAHNSVGTVIAAGAFIAICFLRIPFPVVIGRRRALRGLLLGTESHPGKKLRDQPSARPSVA